MSNVSARLAGPALFLVVAVVCIACNDRTRDPIITFEPPREVDAGDGSADAATDPQPDEICEGATDGARCELLNATGVCARQRCRFVACETGFDDCDEAVGCETSLDGPSSCGSCGTTCAPEQFCERGERSFACTAGLVCPVDRYDLDYERANGCELAASWQPAQTLVPPDLEIQATASHGEVVLLAGITAEGARVSTALPADPYAFAMTPPEPALAVAIASTPTDLRVLWSDGLSRRDPNGESFSALTCADTTPRQYRGLAGDFVATGAEIARIGPDGLEPAFGWAKYLAAFYPHAAADSRWSFAEIEVDACTPCHFDPVTGEPVLPSECVGPRQCRAPDFDDSVCVGCAPLGADCPDFELVGLHAANDHIFAITTRGLVVLDQATLSPVARSESLDTSAALGGPRFIGADVVAVTPSTSLVMLYHSSGFVRGLNVTTGPLAGIEPAFPDLEPGIDLEANPHGAGASLFVAVDGLSARVFALRQSARSAWLTLDSAPGIQGLRPVAIVERSDVQIVYVAAGQVILRTVAPTPTSR